MALKCLLLLKIILALFLLFPLCFKKNWEELKEVILLVSFLIVSWFLFLVASEKQCCPEPVVFSLVSKAPDYSASLVYVLLHKGKQSIRMLLDKGKKNLKHILRTWKRKHPKKCVEEDTRWGGGMRNMRMMCGPKLSGYILMLPILQSQNFNLLT